MPAVTPAYDNKIYQKYSKNTIKNKEKNKIAFCQDFGLPYEKKTTLLCVTCSLVEKNNIAIIQDVMSGILEQGVQLVITGIGNEEYQKYISETQVLINENAETNEDGSIKTARDVNGAETFNLKKDCAPDFKQKVEELSIKYKDAIDIQQSNEKKFLNELELDCETVIELKEEFIPENITTEQLDLIYGMISWD